MCKSENIIRKEPGTDIIHSKLSYATNGRSYREYQRIRNQEISGTNVPTFVLEFLLARYCASDEPNEIQAGMEAGLETLQDNYVRPDEANAAQSKGPPKEGFALST
ncbi:MAG: hypothetical protein GY866_23350 [Proteobacteria bacterium]|nr:hypothetical protein [Pseudomonadota bacterium]